jgi:hypothetical protein
MKPAGTQPDKNMDFDGMASMSPSRSSQYQTNAFTGYMNDGRTVNKGRGPTVGNNGICHPVKGATASVTQDAYRRPPTSATPSVPRQGSVRDNINQGQQDRGAGGTTVKKPSNPDQIRVGQSGGPAYGKTTRGTRPSTSAGAVDFNMGPRSQY